MCCSVLQPVNVLIFGINILTPKTQLLSDFHQFDCAGVDICWFSVVGFDTHWVQTHQNAKYGLFYRALLQKRPMILRSLLIVEKFPEAYDQNAELKSTCRTLYVNLYVYECTFNHITPKHQKSLRVNLYVYECTSKHIAPKHQKSLRVNLYVYECTFNHIAPKHQKSSTSLVTLFRKES